MTSPLEKPQAGYSTLSRLDSSTSRPSTLTVMRSLIGHLVRREVRAQPQEPGEPQPPVDRTLAELQLDHRFRAYPDGAAGILPREGVDERGAGGPQRPEHLQQLAL